MLAGFFFSKESNKYKSFSFAPGKKQTFNFSRFNNLAILRLVTIKSPTISVLSGLYSSASVVLSVLLVGLDISDFVVGIICGVLDDIINM